MCLVESLGAEKVLQNYISVIENKNSIDNISKNDFISEYFSQLSKEELTKLYKIYKDDFDAFGYEFNLKNHK